jgi:ubiquinone biosynthesis protein COQ9
MSDPVRDKVLAEALPEVAAHGFTDRVLREAAERAGVTKRERDDAFAHGAASLVEAFSAWADARMAEHMNGSVPNEHLRERVRDAVRARIEAMAAHREVARRAAQFLASPVHAALAAKLMMRTVDSLWRAAGDTSSDFSYYTKRASLSGVYGATLVYWLADSSVGNEATWKFLDHRMNDVMRIEKWRGEARKIVSQLPDPFKILANLRGGRKP